MWLQATANDIMSRSRSDTASVTPFLATLQPVVNGNLLQYFLQNHPSNKQVALMTAIRECASLGKDTSTIVIDYEYINALLTDFNERVIVLQIILHSKDFVSAYKEQNKQFSTALLYVKECEGHVNNFNLMKKEYEEWSANLKKTIEEIILTEFSHRITMKI